MSVPYSRSRGAHWLCLLLLLVLVLTVLMVMVVLLLLVKDPTSSPRGDRVVHSSISVQQLHAEKGADFVV